MNWSIVKSKQQNMTWIKKGGKRSQVMEPKLTVKKTMLLIAFTCKIFDHSIAQGCYGNCEVYGGIL